MIEFKTLELNDREAIEKCLKASDFKSCDYSFANNYIWRRSNNIEFAIFDGFYCLKSVWKEGTVYTYPAGSGDIKPIVDALIADSRERRVPFRLRGISRENIGEMDRQFPGVFDYTPNMDEFDYIYSTESLTQLAGKKYHSKRNHIARFMDNSDWSYEDITRDNIDECFQMNSEWCKIHMCTQDVNLNHELCAVKEAFAHYFELNFIGGLIRLNGRVIAYTIGEVLSSDTFVVHIEKAFPEIQGSYPMINQQFVIHNCQAFKYVNREEDTGDEGLRKTKLSYKPEILLEKYTAAYKEG